MLQRLCMSSMCAVDVIFEGDRCPLDALKLCMSFFFITIQLGRSKSLYGALSTWIDPWVCHKGRNLGRHMNHQIEQGFHYLQFL